METLRLYEHEAKALLAAVGIPCPGGRLLRSAADTLAGPDLPPPPWVIKSQVLTGGRMKAGGVALAGDLDAALMQVRRLWRHPIKGLLPASILIESQAEITTEYYLAVTYDQQARLPVLVFSPAGGIDVEDMAGRASRGHLPVCAPVADYQVRDVLLAGGVSSTDLAALTRIARGLVRLFLQHDLLLAEINPLARVAGGGFVALDAHVDVDDDALNRQAALLQGLGITDTLRQQRPPTDFERAAQLVDAADHRGVAGRVVEFDGPLGLIIGGGGASLAAFDAIRRHGGRPANYCEIGGNPSVAKVAALTRLLLGRPGVEQVAVIMNVVNNTRADLVARGVIKGIIQAGRTPAETLAVFRIPGAGEEESRQVLRAWGVNARGREVSIDAAAAEAVAALQQRQGRRV